MLLDLYFFCPLSQFLSLGYSLSSLEDARSPEDSAPSETHRLKRPEVATKRLLRERVCVWSIREVVMRTMECITYMYYMDITFNVKHKSEREKKEFQLSLLFFDNDATASRLVRHTRSLQTFRSPLHPLELWSAI